MPEVAVSTWNLRWQPLPPSLVNNLIIKYKIMYLACGDKVIRENQKKLHAYHKKKIADFELLPFWKKIGNRKELLQQVTDDWRSFKRWQNRRILEQSSKN